MSSHKIIYLEPESCCDKETGSLWCEDPMKCESCSTPWIRYDLFVSKKDKLDKLIMKSMGRATTPQTGWDIWQKIKHKTSAQGNDVCVRMSGLCDSGKIARIGYDKDHDSVYELTKEEINNEQYRRKTS